MLALKISDVKDFTNKLFLGSVFDSFWLNEADITTYNTFSIDGRLHRDFLDSDETEIMDQYKRTFSLWKEVKPFCCSIVRGKRTPLSFRIVLQLSYTKTAAAVARSDVDLSMENIHGLYLNIQYKNRALLCTTGTSLRTFVPGKQLEQLWDGLILDFFRRNQILFENL